MNTYFYFQARLCSQYKSVIFYVQLSSMMSISLFLMIFFNLKFMPLQSDILASESDLFYKISVTCFSASQVDFCFFDTKYLQHIFVILQGNKCKYWSRRLACATLGGGCKQSWPLLTLTFFSFLSTFSVHCFSPIKLATIASQRLAIYGASPPQMKLRLSSKAMAYWLQFKSCHL